jgi:hypothetical protein
MLSTTRSPGQDPSENRTSPSFAASTPCLASNNIPPIQASSCPPISAQPAQLSTQFLPLQFAQAPSTEFHPTHSLLTREQFIHESIALPQYPLAPAHPQGFIPQGPIVSRPFGSLLGSLQTDISIVDSTAAKACSVDPIIFLYRAVRLSTTAPPRTIVRICWILFSWTHTYSRLCQS